MPFTTFGQKTDCACYLMSGAHTGRLNPQLLRILTVTVSVTIIRDVKHETRGVICVSVCICQLLARHIELQQSETKAQAALVTILSLTQITELKLLLDIGRQGHRFYEFVLTMLIACISLELLIGIIIIYVGNLHYHQQHDDRSSSSPGTCHPFRLLACLCRCCGRPGQCCRRRVAYSSVMETSVSSGQLGAGGGRGKRGTTAPHNGDELLAPKALPESGMIEENDDEEVGCCGYPTSAAARRKAVSIADLERTDVEIETARIKAAEAELHIVRVGNYIRTLEEAARRATDGQAADLNEQLATLRADNEAAAGIKKEADAERRAAEARQYHAFYARELAAARRERVVFRKLSRWQHAATYLLYFVMLMNIFVTTFGISGSSQDLFVVRPINASTFQ